MTTTTSPPHDRWAGMPDDLLVSVFQLLDVPGRICFRLVCRSWRAAVVQDPRRGVVRMPPPWVVIPDGIGCSKSFTLISIPTQHEFRWTPAAPGLRVVGSNGGWLAGAYISNADRTLRISLVNPLTNARVEMPVVGRVSSVSRHESRVERVLSTAVQKVAFSQNPTTQSFAVAVVGMTRSRVPASFGIAFARAGSQGWCAYAKIQDCEEHRGDQRYSVPQLDVAYNDGKFYYLTPASGDVWAVDMAAPSPSSVSIAKFSPTNLRFSSVFSCRRCTYHLAFSRDGALHVVSSMATGYAPCSGMLLQRYDPSACPQWTSPTRLRDQCFLVGDFNQTMCVPTDGGDAWLRPDSVYFTNIPICSLLADHGILRDSRDDGVWLFNLDNGTIERPENFQRVSKHVKDKETWDSFRSGLDWHKAIWFMPSIW